jgi:hypothetical protein
MGKTTRNAISNDQKREICQYKKDNPKAKNVELISHLLRKNSIDNLVSPFILFMVKQLQWIQKRLVKKMLDGLDESDKIVYPNVKEALYMLVGAWNDVSKSTIVNCWNHANIIE